MIERNQVRPVSLGTWALGGWMWGGLRSEQEGVNAILAALSEGMNAIDTAPIYGQGDSELLVGKALKQIPRDQVYVMTKFGMRWDTTQGSHAMTSRNNEGEAIEVYKYAGPDSIRTELEASLQRLGTDYIDLYQIHWPDVTTPIHDTFEVVAQLIKEGKIRHAGVCNYNVAQLKQAIEVCPIVSNQVPYSMLNRGIENELVPFCLENNIGILAYSPMERGLLTGKINTATSFEPGDHRSQHKLFQQENIIKVDAFLQAIAPMAEKHNATLGQLVLAWTVKQPGIWSVLAGARTVEQAIGNARAMHINLAHEEILYINKQLSIYFPFEV